MDGITKKCMQKPLIIYLSLRTEQSAGLSERILAWRQTAMETRFLRAIEGKTKRARVINKVIINKELQM